MGGGASMNNVYYTIFTKALCLSLLSNGTPCDDSIMQIVVETLQLVDDKSVVSQQTCCKLIVKTFYPQAYC